MLYLIDASIYIFRAWFSVPSTLTGNNGQSVNAAYGFVRFLTEFLEQTHPKKVVIAFDESLTRSFRNDIYPQYKMNRELPPEALKLQFELCRRIAESLGLYCISSDRYEADDLIGTYAVEAQKNDVPVTIVSADKDLAQLLTLKDQLWDFARRKYYQIKDIEEKFGVQPDQITDFLGLCGDVVDNIPGVPGIGAKTAAVILQVYSDMDSVYQNLESLAELKVRGAKTLASKLSEHEAQARLSKKLATIECNAPIDCDLNNATRKKMNNGMLTEISVELGGRANGLFERISHTI